MERTYEILKTTDSLSRAVENKSLIDVQEVLIELRDDVREFKVNDESHPEVIEELNKLLDAVKMANGNSLDDFPEDIATQISLVVNRVDSLYLRNIKNDRDKKTSEEPVEEVRLEREMYRTKSIQLARVVERYRSVLSNQLEGQRETYDTVGEMTQELMDGIESSNILETIDIDERLEEIEEVNNELEKMRSRSEEFREEYGLDE